MKLLRILRNRKLRGRLFPRFLKAFWRRFGWAEVFSTAAALLFATGADLLGGGAVIIALSASMGENFGFYGYLTFDATKQKIKKDKSLRFRKWRLAREVFVDQLFELGPSEILDNVIRPSVTFAALKLIDNVYGGVILGKIIADIAYYTVIPFSLAFRKKVYEFANKLKAKHKD